MDENEIGTIIIDTAISVHRDLGSGLLESVYEIVLAKALQDRGLNVERQVSIRISWRGHTFEEGFKADLVVNNLVIIELKSIEKTDKSHAKQLLTYLRLSGKRLGYLLNFGERLMKNGITRLSNNAPDIPLTSSASSARE